MDRMSRPYENEGIWSDAFIMKFITFCFDKALHLWDIRPFFEGRTYCAIWSYLENVDLDKRSINIAYADDHYHPMTPLS
jgi:hypothetical protein